MHTNPKYERKSSIQIKNKPDSCINQRLFSDEIAYIQCETHFTYLLLELTKSEFQRMP